MFKLISASDKRGEVKAEAFISISNIPDFKQNYKVICSLLLLKMANMVVKFVHGPPLELLKANGNTLQCGCTLCLTNAQIIVN